MDYGKHSMLNKMGMPVNQWEDKSGGVGWSFFG